MAFGLFPRIPMPTVDTPLIDKEWFSMADSDDDEAPEARLRRLENQLRDRELFLANAYRDIPLIGQKDDQASDQVAFLWAH